MPIFVGTKLNDRNLQFLQRHSTKRRAITFDEITLEDKPTDIHPNDVEVDTHITRRVKLKSCGIMSAAMDTVTECEMALAIAKMGGIGILHRNLDIETQCKMVQWVRKKIHYGGMIDDPITFPPNMRYSTFQQVVAAKNYPFTSYPIVDEDRTFLGLITSDEMDFVQDTNPLLREAMKPEKAVVTAPQGTDSDSAYAIMLSRRVKKLPIVDKDNKLAGMYVWSDVKDDKRKRETFSLDEDGHFLVGAAIGLGPDDNARAQQLVECGCKVIVVDSSHGSCAPAKEKISFIKKNFGDKVQLIVGNIASYESAKYLLEGEFVPDALKVGIGPGSICTTRQVTGHGIPQITAIFEVTKAILECEHQIPIIADGGIRCSGDIVKCYAAGASAVMLGSVLAGTHESPGRLIERHGKTYKTIRGMGSRSAMSERSGSRGRYYREDDQTNVAESLTQAQKEKMAPEGVEGVVELKGSVEKVLRELIEGVKAGLAHSGARNISDFQQKAGMWIQSTAGVIEGKPHDIWDVQG